MLLLWNKKALHPLYGFAEKGKNYLVVKFQHHLYRLQQPLQLKKRMIARGKLSIREPCSPYINTKSIVTAEGEVTTTQVKIVGRKLSLLEIRQKLHSKYMRLMTDQQIKELTREILQLMSIAHYHASPTATTDQLQQQLAVLQRSRTLAVWHDHSTVLRQGYILFVVWVVYDTGVYLTEHEYRAAKAVQW